MKTASSYETQLPVHRNTKHNILEDIRTIILPESNAEMVTLYSKNKVHCHDSDTKLRPNCYGKAVPVHAKEVYGDMEV